MKFEDIFRLNLKCWKKKRNCLKCKKIKACGKFIGYENKQAGYDPF